MTSPNISSTAAQRRARTTADGPVLNGKGPAPGSDAPQVDETLACFRLRIERSKIHRWGIYAGEPIPKNRKVIEYTGERISRKETKIRASRPLNYIFMLDKYWSIDGSSGGSGAQYINHCCDPNLVARILKGHILYFSRRAISEGEELTVDYHFDKDVDKVPCHCGSALCRGTINLLV